MAITDLYLPPRLFEEIGVTKAAKANVDAAEIGSTGLLHYGGVLNEELLPSLRSDRFLRLGVEMLDNDPIVGGLMLAIDNLVRRVSWEFEPADDTPEAARWAEFMDTVIGDMSSSWADTVSSIFSFVPFGWSYHEVVLKQRQGDQSGDGSPTAAASSKYDDRLVGWRKLPIRAQESRTRWKLDDNGGVQGMYQVINYSDERFIPIERALLFRVGSRKESPEPLGILRAMYRSWWFKRRFEELEGVGIERDLAGLPIGEVPADYLSANASPEQKATVTAVKALVTSVRRNSEEGVVWPRAFDERGNKLYELSLLQGSGKRQLDIDAAIARKNMEIAICGLADWLLLGHESVGSKALGTTKVDMFTTALETWTQGMADVITTHATPRLLRLNGVSRDLVPVLRPGRVSQVDIEMFSVAISNLVKTGSMAVDGPLEDWVRSTVGAPAREETIPGMENPDTPDAPTDPTQLKE